MINPQMRHLLLLVLIAIVALALQARPVDDKLAPADIVAKHLESIGSAAARAKMQGTRIKGTATVTVKLCGEGQVDGQVLMGSKGDVNLINLKFDTPAYPFETLVYDGKKFTASQFKPGARTCLANRGRC
jgi:hypothetical protein